MKQKLLNIKRKLDALWWLLTRKNHYLLSYNDRESGYLESYNVVIPQFIEWIRMEHGVPTNNEIIKNLEIIDDLCKDVDDFLAHKEVEALIEKLRK